jgi:hypothetical protein
MPDSETPDSETPASETNRPNMAELRGLAALKLAQLNKNSLPVREKFLFENGCYAGVHFESGPFCFLWKAPEDFASIKRGDLIIETVSFGENSQVRRAA